VFLCLSLARTQIAGRLKTEEDSLGNKLIVERCAILARGLQNVCCHVLLTIKEKSMLPSTVDRVPNQTSQHVNEQIRRQTEQSIEQVYLAGSAAIAQRLAELDAEWDVERTLQANAATASMIGVALGATVDRRWFVLPAVVGAFLLQHALQGWCPPLPVFRRLGFRTASEIDYERYALKALRGDFANLSDPSPSGPQKIADKALRAAEV
jgi:Protein of unknown function (DUF2892)